MKRRRPLGQNFLVDLHAAREIVRLAGLDPQGHVVEIGPGKGVLTHDLLPATGRLTALEIDPKLCHSLTKKFGDHPGFHLIQGDALKFDFGSLPAPYQVVSNLPYYAATHILKRLIHFRQSIADMTLMVQKEVADRLVAAPGSRSYGSLSVFTQFYCAVGRLMEVDRQCFYPQPKVESTVLKFTPRRQSAVEVEDLKTFFHLVNAAFFHKRKTLKNNLRPLAQHFTINFKKIEGTGVQLSQRAEELTLEQFARIANTLEIKNGGKAS
ncbi:MAG: 16S rRNA (adenine(1518)-N(6)/adenine(1519)-N(6))-dimethyltransferase RsmA [Nitrospinaceae bacterium]